MTTESLERMFEQPRDAPGCGPADAIHKHRKGNPVPVLFNAPFLKRSLSNLEPAWRTLPRTPPVTTGCFLLFVLIIVATVTEVWAQNGIDTVHVDRAVTTDAKVARVDPSIPPRNKSFKVDTELVIVPMTVTDTMNRPILGLGKENFRVWEGKREQEISSFSCEDEPISIGVLIDTSRSVGKKIERVREAVIEFLRAANPQDQFFTLAFNDTPHGISDFTSSVEDVQSQLPLLVPQGRTALLDAVYSGISRMRFAKYSRKALLIISDGGDNHSRYTEKEIQTVVAESDVLVYAIGVYDRFFVTEEEEYGSTLLHAITEPTGGRTFTVDNPNDLGDLAAKIGMELRNQYVIGYRPEKTVRDGKWHPIKVKLLPPRGNRWLNVYARQGYYSFGE